VDLYHSGTSVIELSNEYGVSEVTIYKWIKDFTPIGTGEEFLTPKELAAIQKENLRLKQEIETLKRLWPYSRKNNRYRAYRFYGETQKSLLGSNDV